MIPVVGDASEEAVAGRAADPAEEAGPLFGWVNNATVFRDASLHSAPMREVLDLVTLNLGLAVVGLAVVGLAVVGLAVVGCATAVRRFLAAGKGGASASFSSHHRRNGRFPAPCRT